jgi:hypothetical protein
METIHIMDFIFSIRQHLMAYGGAASLGNAPGKGLQGKLKWPMIETY